MKINDPNVIQDIMMRMAELGAASYVKRSNPELDLISQREAYKFLLERDRQFYGKVVHGESWVKKMANAGKLTTYRRGHSRNSRIMYSRAELIAAWNADRADFGGYFDGVRL